MQKFNPWVAVAVFTAALIPAAPARAADQILQYLPDGAIVVISFNIKQMLDAPLVKLDQKAFDKAMDAATKEFKKFGMDPKADLTRIVMSAAEGRGPESFVILLEGKFNTSKIEDQLEEMAKDKKNNLKSTKEGSAKVFVGEVPQGSMNFPGAPSNMYMTILDDKLVAVAMDKTAITDVIGRKSKRSELPRELPGLVEKMSNKESISIVVLPPAAMTQGPMAEVTSITGGLTAEEGMKLDLTLATKTGDGAKQLADQINDGLAQAKQMIPLVAGGQGVSKAMIGNIIELINKLKADAKPNGVAVQAELSRAFFQKLISSRAKDEEKKDD